MHEELDSGVAMPHSPAFIEVQPGLADVATPILDKEQDLISGRATAEAASRTLNMQPCVMRNSRWRPNAILSSVVPPLLAAFILYGGQFASRFIVPHLRTTASVQFYHFYSITFHALLATTFFLFLYVWLTPEHHSEPCSSPPPAILRGTMPYQRHSPVQAFAYCWQDECNGRVMPPRARHCKDCRRCRLDFDHHCPWVGCIARDTLKGFLLFLATVPFTISWALWPVFPLAIQQFKLVRNITWEQDWMYATWWNKKYSWLGGPLFRYLGATVLGYWHYPPSLVGQTVSLGTNTTGKLHVSFTLVFYCILGPVLAVLTAFLFGISTYYVLRGTSTIEVERLSKRRKLGVAHLYGTQYVHVPSMDDQTQPSILEIPSTVRLYDFGTSNNWSRVFGRSLWLWFLPWDTSDSLPEEIWQISPAALASQVKHESPLDTVQ